LVVVVVDVVDVVEDEISAAEAEALLPGPGEVPVADAAADGPAADEAAGDAAGPVDAVPDDDARAVDATPFSAPVMRGSEGLIVVVVVVATEEMWPGVHGAPPKAGGGADGKLTLPKVPGATGTNLGVTGASGINGVTAKGNLHFGHANQLSCPKPVFIALWSECKTSCEDRMMILNSSRQIDTTRDGATLYILMKSVWPPR
jgi:hypothetical protein